MGGNHQTTIVIRDKYRRKESMNKYDVGRGKVVKRQWAILARLHTSQHTIADLASQFQMSTKNIHRDIVAMIAAGLPINYDDRYVFLKDQNQNKENESMNEPKQTLSERKRNILCKYGCGQMMSSQGV